MCVCFQILIVDSGTLRVLRAFKIGSGSAVTAVKTIDFARRGRCVCVATILSSFLHLYSRHHLPSSLLPPSLPPSLSFLAPSTVTSLPTPQPYMYCHHFPPSPTAITLFPTLFATFTLLQSPSSSPPLPSCHPPPPLSSPPTLNCTSVHALQIML